MCEDDWCCDAMCTSIGRKLYKRSDGVIQFACCPVLGLACVLVVVKTA